MGISRAWFLILRLAAAGRAWYRFGMNDPALPDAEQLRALVAEIAAAFMPFGKYGPAHFPPEGCPVMDLPLEYLAWFQMKGFPKGKLGRLMEQSFLLRTSGLDDLFAPFRQARGGRATGKKRPRVYRFTDSES